ncbi:hypothetical protein M011DRAFT_405812 [Sporormia fimetaria CBS 119925]|uniref:Rhodopsin domain-containing protein n=1 Tax=Sporormia fimetaria CBS 119925 TaxID=1340428 RepID=A0A6A6V893_9PLEO|nr:hypothetical protein M011DRAFT_405812 [Sporormia fimetaria CBS 119925]
MAGPACAGKEGINLRVSVATGVFNVVSDLYILILPLPAVRKLKLSPRRKLGVYLIFSTGGLACIASILTLAFRSKNYGTADITVDSVPTMIFKYVQPQTHNLKCANRTAVPSN